MWGVPCFHTCADREDVPVSKETPCQNWKNPRKLLFPSQQETKIRWYQSCNSEPTSATMNMNDVHKRKHVTEGVIDGYGRLKSPAESLNI